LLRCTPKSYTRYIEPFAGSACFFFALKPTTATLGDFNAQLIHAYNVVSRHPRLVARGVTQLRNNSRTYYNQRSISPSSLDEVSRAVRFMYLNRYCFNGVYRTNRRDHFNVPRGSHVGRPLSEAEVYRCSLALRAATLVAGDFEETLRDAGKSDFVYLDPPYSTTTRPTLGEYGYGAFSAADIDRLVGCVRRLAKQGAQILLSYAENDAVTETLRDWSVVPIKVRRQVAGGLKNTSAVEILASNFTDLRAAV
jgi:DNA adenine methylase